MCPTSLCQGGNLISTLISFILRCFLFVRMALHVTTLFTLFTIFNASREESPHTSYTKVSLNDIQFDNQTHFCQALDVWVVGSFAVVFIVLIEYCIVLLFVHKLEKKKAELERVESIELEKQLLIEKRSISLIEFYSKICVALFFICFNAVYWSYYIRQFLAEEYEWINEN